MTKKPPKEVWVTIDDCDQLADVNPTARAAKTHTISGDRVIRYILPTKPKKVKR